MGSRRRSKQRASSHEKITEVLSLTLEREEWDRLSEFLDDYKAHHGIPLSWETKEEKDSRDSQALSGILRQLANTGSIEKALTVTIGADRRMVFTKAVWEELCVIAGKDIKGLKLDEATEATHSGRVWVFEIADPPQTGKRPRNALDAYTVTEATDGRRIVRVGTLVRWLQDGGLNVEELKGRRPVRWNADSSRLEIVAVP